jgi:putative hydrolase of the HAD superfamily
LGEITKLFWDIGGVILTNGWDSASRRQAASVFQLDWDEFQDRHDLTYPAFDCGQVTLNEYLDRTLFYRPRSFTREEFTAFMFAQSKEYPETRAVLDSLAASGKYFLAAINNEPLELNQYRIEAFHLRKDFVVFFSSCYVGARKPDPTIYRLALQVTQSLPEQCVFIDDRPINLEHPRQLGLSVIHYQNPEQLRAELNRLGIEVPRR